MSRIPLQRSADTLPAMRVIDLRTDPEASLPRAQVSEDHLLTVREIIADVRDRGDQSLFDLTERFDGVRLETLRITTDQIERAAAETSADVMEAMRESATRIRQFASRQLITAWRSDIGGGSVGEVVSPIRRAGAYVPGGRAVYPSSVLMSAIPAQVAGVGEFAMCIPPTPDGKIPAVTLAAASIAGVREIYTVGGAQAIAAMAYGTESIPKVDLIVGPGNIYVALAKQEVSGTVAIDSVAGPSEIVVVADGSADPRIIAYDLIAQAEHGPNGTFVLITWSEGLIEQTQRWIDQITSVDSSDAVLAETLRKGLYAVRVKDREQASQSVKRFAPEHLELIFESAEDHLDEFRTAGAVFVGRYSPVSIGDYLAGTNHILPTSGGAAWASGLRASTFQRTAAVIFHSRESLDQASDHIHALATIEGLPYHSRAVKARFEEDMES